MLQCFFYVFPAALERYAQAQLKGMNNTQYHISVHREYTICDIVTSYKTIEERNNLFHCTDTTPTDGLSPSMISFTATVVFIGWSTIGILSMVLVSLYFCRNLCITMWLALKPISQHATVSRRLVGHSCTIRMCCLLHLTCITCCFWETKAMNLPKPAFHTYA